MKNMIRELRRHSAFDLVAPLVPFAVIGLSLQFSYSSFGGQHPVLGVASIPVGILLSILAYEWIESA